MNRYIFVRINNDYGIIDTDNWSFAPYVQVDVTPSFNSGDWYWVDSNYQISLDYPFIHKYIKVLKFRKDLSNILK